MSLFTKKQLEDCKEYLVKVMAFYEVPLLSEEAHACLEFENASLDDILFNFSAAIAIDYPEFSQEENHDRAMRCVASLLVLFADEFIEPEVENEDPINPVTFFRNWVRISKERSGR